MEKRTCAACGEEFRVLPNVPRQTYCSDSDCQKVRKRRWQTKKLGTDPDYQSNQKAAQAKWRESHPGYWGEYRENHPEYTACNRRRQRMRNRNRQADDGENDCKNGRVNGKNAIKTDWLQNANDCKERTCETFPAGSAIVLAWTQPLPSSPWKPTNWPPPLRDCASNAQPVWINSCVPLPRPDRLCLFW